jgi:hypothetical protein
MKARQLRTAKGAHRLGLLGRFNAFGRGFDSKSARQRQDRMHDRHAFAGPLRRAANERLVDLIFENCARAR